MNHIKKFKITSFFSLKMSENNLHPKNINYGEF